MCLPYPYPPIFTGKEAFNDFCFSFLTQFVPDITFDAQIAYICDNFVDTLRVAPLLKLEAFIDIFSGQGLLAGYLVNMGYICSIRVDIQS